jgi:hypothetical protein
VEVQDTITAITTVKVAAEAALKAMLVIIQDEERSQEAEVVDTTPHKQDFICMEDLEEMAATAEEAAVAGSAAVAEATLQTTTMVVVEDLVTL